MTPSPDHLNGVVRADTEPFSALAWELARRARFLDADPEENSGRVCAIVDLANGDRVSGFGGTTTEATRRLAMALMVLS